jgi:hypothetical protein
VLVNAQVSACVKRGQFVILKRMHKQSDDKLHNNHECIDVFAILCKVRKAFVLYTSSQLKSCLLARTTCIQLVAAVDRHKLLSQFKFSSVAVFHPSKIVSD